MPRPPPCTNTKDKAADEEEERGKKDEDHFIEALQALFALTSINDAYASLEAVVMTLKQLARKRVKHTKELKAASARTKRYKETDGSSSWSRASGSGEAHYRSIGAG